MLFKSILHTYDQLTLLPPFDDGFTSQMIRPEDFIEPESVPTEPFSFTTDREAVSRILLIFAD